MARERLVRYAVLLVGIVAAIACIVPVVLFIAFGFICYWCLTYWENAGGRPL